MIKETLSKLEAALGGLEPADKAKKAALLRLLAELKKEVSGLETGVEGRAARVARSNQAAARLAERLRDFESAHPRLVEAADALCRELAALGI